MEAELGLAREKMAFAQHLGASGANQEMRWLVEQAEVDAELAHVRGLAVRAELAHTRGLATRATLALAAGMQR
jgi:hypothetical protein